MLIESLTFVRFATRAALTSFAIALPACGPAHPDRVALVPARGRVLYDGKPAAGVELRFHPDPPRGGDDLTPVARSGDDGSFTLTTYEPDDGAPAGSYRVGLRWPEAKPGVVSGPRPDRLKGGYRDPTKTPWRATIAAPGAVLETIEIPALDESPSSRKPSRTKPAKSHDGPRTHEGEGEPRP